MIRVDAGYVTGGIAGDGAVGNVFYQVVTFTGDNAGTVGRTAAGFTVIADEVVPQGERLIGGYRDSTAVTPAAAVSRTGVTGDGHVVQVSLTIGMDAAAMHISAVVADGAVDQGQYPSEALRSPPPLEPVILPLALFPET